MSKGIRLGFSQILETCLQDPGIDAVICCVPSFMPRDCEFSNVADLLREIAGRYPHKPIAVTSFGGDYQFCREEIERDQNAVYYFSMEQAAKALSALYRYHNTIKNKNNESGLQQLAILPDDVDALNHDRLSELSHSTALFVGNNGNLSQDSALDLLREYHIPTIRWNRAGSLAQARDAADVIGYPVVMKILSPDIIHKSDLGGVKLKIENSRQLEEAYDAMMKEIKQKQPNAAVEGVIIQEYLSGGIELLLGSKMDPIFGPVLVFGAGGIFAEILDDISMGFLPLSREKAAKMIAATKINKILAGARSREVVDMELLISCLQNLAKLVMANPEILELDINPLLAFPDRVAALDARVILS
jgi:acetyltransferase